MTPLVVIGCSRERASIDAAGQNQGSGVSQDVVAIVADYCGGCHAPPRPQSHDPAEWPAIVARMQEHRIRTGMSPIPAEELDRIIDYLQQSMGNA